MGQTAYSPDGSTLYAALNGQNTVVAIDPNTGAVEHTWNVGIAPRELKFVGNTLYVSDEGGRQAQPGDTTMDSYGTAVPANGYLGTSTTGEVSVINTSNPSAPVGSIAVGLHPTAMYANGNALFVANTNSDTVSVIDTTTDQVVQTIETKPWPESTVGYEPDSIAMTKRRPSAGHLGEGERGRGLPVRRHAEGPGELHRSAADGLLPVGRGDRRQPDRRHQHPRHRRARPGDHDLQGRGNRPGERPRHAQHHRIPDPLHPSERPDIARDTATVFAQNGWGKNDVQEASGHKAAPVPVPTRIGDPSTIKHVFLIVKENRTYDQVFGDMGEGNGDPSLTQFGEKTTPNQHALARQFGLYDNVYDVGTNSAEGHNWLMQGDDPEYTESSAGEYQRSYDTEEDVLGHQRSGFLWTAVESAGNDGQELRRVRVHGGQAARHVAAVLLRGQERR